MLLRVGHAEALVQLIISDDGCGSACILPRVALERIVLQALRSEYPGLDRVVLLDPRDEQEEQ